MWQTRWLMGLWVGCWLLPQAVHAQGVPGTVGFTARLQEGGAPVTGNRDFHVAVFDAVTGGTPRWTEDHTAVPVVDGLVYLELGAQNGLDAAIFSGTSRWLEVSVGALVLTPRTPLDSVPYAIRADVAQSAEGIGTLTAADLVTDVAAASPLSVLRTGNTVTLSLDTSALQARVVGSCGPGSSVRAIAADGTVSCETDDVGTGTVTQVDTGFGVLGGPITGAGTLSVDTSAVQARVVGTCGPGMVLRAVNADGTVTCAAETDPRVGTLTANQWCTANAAGSVVDCGQPPPARANQTCAAGTSVRGFDAAGNVLCTQDVRFLARRQTNFTWPSAGGENAIPLDQEILDTANALNPASATFTAPVSGLYALHAYGMVENVPVGSLVYILIRAAGTTYYGNGGYSSSANWVQMTAAATVFLNAGQSATFMGNILSNPPGAFMGNAATSYNFTAFSGALVH